MLQVCNSGMWRPGYSAEGPKDSRNVLERDEKIQSGFAEGNAAV